MPTHCFDFDSTLIDRESLDEILARVLAGRSGDAAEVRRITAAGMEGEIDFRRSMERRLAIARPTRAQVEEYGREAVEYLTPGIARLVSGLEGEVWIVSGGLREVLLPVAEKLGVPAERVVGTVAAWDPDGSLRGLVRCGPKEEALRGLAGAWPRPRIAVGDGMSDYALLLAGCVDHFVAFTGHARRAAVVATGAPEAGNVSELEYVLERLS